MPQPRSRSAPEGLDAQAAITLIARAVVVLARRLCRRLATYHSWIRSRSVMAQQDRASSRRNRLAAPFGWLARVLRNWKNPWLAGLWLSAVIAAVVLSVLPGSWLSLTRRGLPDAAGDVIESLLHFLGYAVLVGFVSMACRSFTTLIYVFFAAIGISVALEVVKLLVPERGASLVDLTMNVLGACAGCLFGAARLKRKMRL
jgi:VanZ family protein